MFGFIMIHPQFEYDFLAHFVDVKLEFYLCKYFFIYNYDYSFIFM